MSLQKLFSLEQQKNNGFTLVEIVVVATILVILASTGFSLSQSVLHQRRVKSLALDFAAWLEEARSASMSRTSEIDSLGGCAITIYPATQASNMYRIASVSPASCTKRSGNGDFNIDDPSSAKYAISVTESSFQFTPRGTMLSTNLADVDLSIYRLDSGPVACVRTTGVLGIIQLGYNGSPSSSSSACPNASYSSY